MRRRVVALLGCLVALAGPLAAQTTREDSAAVVLDAARTLERDGRVDAARELYRLIGRKYAGTSAAVDADQRLLGLPGGNALGTGRTGFVLFNTLYGAFLGVAIPAAAGAESSGPYGAGLLIGAPAGFLASRAFARRYIRTSGQAGVASFATVWGTWQALGWRQVLDLGEDQVCTEFGCYTDESDTAPWTAVVVGGLAGLATGYALAATREVADGTASLTSYSGLWGTWFGLTLGRVAGLEDDGLLAAALVGGDVLLLAALPASRHWRPTPSRIRLITAAGLAGGLVGFGVDLIGNVNDDKAAIAIPAIGSALGLLVGAATTSRRPDLDAGGAGLADALVDLHDGLRLGVPLPLPSTVRVMEPLGRSRLRPAIRIDLLHASF